MTRQNVELKTTILVTKYRQACIAAGGVHAGQAIQCITLTSSHWKQAERSSLLGLAGQNLLAMASTLRCLVPWIFSKTKDDCLSSPVLLPSTVLIYLRVLFALSLSAVVTGIVHAILRR